MATAKKKARKAEEAAKQAEKQRKGEEQQSKKNNDMAKEMIPKLKRAVTSAKNTVVLATSQDVDPESIRPLETHLRELEMLLDGFQAIQNGTATSLPPDISNKTDVTSKIGLAGKAEAFVNYSVKK